MCRQGCQIGGKEVEKEKLNKKQLRRRNGKVTAIVIAVIFIFSMLLIFLNHKVNNVGKDVTDKTDTIHQVMEENRMSVNDRIISLGKEYDTYKTEAEESIKVIRQDLILVSDGTNMNFEVVRNDFAGFNESYGSFIQNMDSQIAVIQSEMEMKTVNEEFETFIKSYETYRSSTDKTVTVMMDTLENLDETKADEDSLILLTENLGALESSYQTFVGENGAFESLVIRIAEQENVSEENKSDIGKLENVSEENKSDIEELENRIIQLEAKMAGEHPVGSFYISVTDENPAELYGGEWERIEDTFLMCAGENYPAGSEGGSNQILLSENQIPSLSITGKTKEKSGIKTEEAGSHSHTVTTNAVNGVGSTSISGSHTHMANSLNYWLESYNPISSNPIAIAGNGAAYNLPSSGEHSHTLNIPSLSGNTNETGSHSHTLTLPALDVAGSFLNKNQQQIDVTNKYLSVYVWKRVA